MLDKVEDFAKTLDDWITNALAGLPVPLPGQWNLNSVSVIVNNKEFARFDLKSRLKRHNPSVTSFPTRLSPEAQFVRGLRANINSQSHEFDEALSGVTTPFFKDMRISGWESRPLASATVIGTLKHPPSPGNDGFVSLDLEVKEVEAAGQVFSLAGLELPRYIRIEYANQRDPRYPGWNVGTTIRASGSVLWDTDQYGFYELHPNRASQVTPVSQQGTLATPGIQVSDLVPEMRRKFQSQYSRGYKEGTWHVIAGSFSSEDDAILEANKLNAKYPELFFEETQSNEKRYSGQDIWMVTLGSGVGKSDADYLCTLAKNTPGLADAFEYRWGVGSGGKCENVRP